ncbi:La-related protein 6 [Hordeum vulgare]|nr:La-related protein 6 [Hordeum vulgare]
MSNMRYIAAWPPSDGEVAAEVDGEADYDDEVTAQAAGEDDYGEEMASKSSGEFGDFKAVRQQVPVWLHTNASGYDIKLVNGDGLTGAISQVKWPTHNPSVSTPVDLMQVPAVDLLSFALNNMPSFIAMEPLLSF